MTKIEAMRLGGKILARVLDETAHQVRAGITGIELDKYAESEIVKAGGKPAFKGYEGYPASLCVSVNDEVVHGIPDNVPIKTGDLVSLDLGVEYQGYFTDAAVTVIATETGCKTLRDIYDDKIDKNLKLYESERLLYVTYYSLSKAINTIKNGVTTGDIGHFIQNYAEENHFGVVRDLVGHGVGEAIHQKPNVPNFGNAGSGDVLHTGDTIAIEPMLTMRDWHVKQDNDGWTVRTRDQSWAAHFEHTVVVTENGCEILTLI
ncbi:MAG: type I methionyl aminopeptidase [Patescibacteria group bacterium]|jgi:methionyl aminopeptidase